MARRRREEIEKTRIGRRPSVTFRRPAERLEQDGRVEDIRPRRFWPLLLDEADDGEAVDVDVARRLVVEETHAGGARHGRKRFVADPSADEGRHVVDRGGRIVVRLVR